MADSQRIIEFLRDVRQGAGSGGLQTVTEEIAHMAAEYAALCTSANERLRKCTGFLQQGLRTEAIHLAEEPPNLLDLVSQLDLPDPQSWAEFCQNNGFPVPPALQLERAAQLNEAYAQDQPLEHLLARHRLLALSRAPVRERLDVMRKIAQIDAGSATWEKDIRIFEQARLKELPSAFYNAVKNHDNHAIAGLMEELNGQPWFEAPPAELTASVSEAFARIQRQGVEAELRKLVEPLREAYAARSLQECQALVQRWKNAMAAAGVTHVAGELMDEIKPVVAFIAEQTKRDEFVKRFTESCKAFAKMLDADAPDAQLEAGYAKLKDFKEEIPEELTRRYMNKRAGRRRDAERKHKLRLATIAGVFVAAIVLSLWVGYIVLRSRNTTKWAKEINDAVALHSVEGLNLAQKCVEELQATNPALLKEPAVSQAASNLAVEQQRFASDTARLKTAAAKVERALQAANKAQDGPIDAMRIPAGDLDAAISEAAELLKGAEWADAGNNLSAAIEGARKEWQSLQERVLGQVRERMKEINTDLNAVPEHPSTPAEVVQAQNQLAALKDRTAALAGLPLLDPAAKTDIAALLARITQRLLDAEGAGGMVEELQNVRTLAGSAGELKNALTNFVNRFPADPRTPEFKAALERLPAAESLEAWTTKLEGYKGALAPASLADAQKKLDDVTAFLAAHPEFPKLAPAGQYADYLKHAVEAMGDKGPWQTAFEPLVTNPLLRDLSYMLVNNGDKYYTLGDPNRVEHKLMNQVSVTFDTINLKPDKDGKVDYNLKVNKRVEFPDTVSDKPTLAPHAVVVREIEDGLKAIGEGNWDSFGIDLADKLASNDQMDIVVKAILLRQALMTQVTVAGFMTGDVYDPTISKLERQKADELPWPDPMKITDGTRAAIKAIVEAMPKAPAVRQRLADAKDALFKSITLEVMNTGVLLKDDVGTWVVYSRATPVSGATVWVLVPGPAAPPPASAPATAAAPATDAAPEAPAAAPPAPAVPGLGPTSLVKVGTAANGRFVLDEAAIHNVPQGSLVFITR